MDTVALNTDHALIADGPAARPRRQRLAIVSTTNRLCGIAVYTAALQKQLATFFDVTVIDLDQYLLRGRPRRLRRLGDRHIEELCRELGDFDAVNLQLEHGTLGGRTKDIYRRFCRIAAAAPRLSVTFHTLWPAPEFSFAALGRALVRGQFRAAVRMPAEFNRSRVLSSKIAARLRRTQRIKQVAAIVHTRQDRNRVRHLHGLTHVVDHPLAFLSTGEAAAVRGRASRRNFPILDRVPDAAILISVFGFISDYKGLEVAIRALRHLPETHHLLIFGGVHPNEIIAGRPIHPYLERLLEEARVDATPFDRIKRVPRRAPVQLTIDGRQGLGALLGSDPGDLSARMHFMGAPANDEFLSAMAICDVVVFPYLEVGQSASGPISQALELGCRIVASRTHAFLAFADYHRDAVEFFEIGNHLELSERIRARRQFPPGDIAPAFNAETNAAVYLKAISPNATTLTAAAGSTAPARAVRAP